MNINTNSQNTNPNSQQQATTSIQENTALRVRIEQNRQQNFDTIINNRTIDKITTTKNLVGVFSNEVLDKLIDKKFFVSETGSWRNRMYYIFKNEQTGKQITADEDYHLDLNSQVLSKLLEIETLESRINSLTNLNNQPNVDINTFSFNSWVPKVANTINTLYRIIDEISIDRAIARGFYLDQVNNYTRNIVSYTFKSRNSNYIFCISTDNLRTLTEQLNNKLALGQPSIAPSTTATTSIPTAIDTLSEEQISSINSYGYKIIVISKALANMHNEERTLLIHNMDNPYVDNLQLFKEIILESIYNLDSSEQDRMSYVHLINNTMWSLVEINTIIRKGILLLDS